ncbi:hypothetical protein Tco_1320377 [Tanacetum coccineum]
MLLCKQEEVGVQLNAEQADWKDDTDDESDDQELEAHYMYMAQIHEVTPDSVDNSGPIFDDEPMHKGNDLLHRFSWHRFVNSISLQDSTTPQSNLLMAKANIVSSSELLNGNSPVVSKSSAVHAADNPDKRQQHNTTHTSTTTDVADPPPLNIHSTHQTPT